MTFGSKNLDAPDETIRLPKLVEQVVEVGGFLVGLETIEPGWKWSVDTKPVVGGEWREARHVGVTLSGRWGVLLESGETIEYGPNDVFDVPARHDSWTVGDEPCVVLNWTGLRTFFAAKALLPDRFLATILFTDVVDSTATAGSLGDLAWVEVLDRHQHNLREAIEAARGRLVQVTGDGVLAIFDGPAAALRCADAIRSIEGGLPIRAGIHVGEVESSGEDIRGIAVHEAARVMGQAGPGEILVSDTVRSLLGDDLGFADRGEYELKGLEGPRRLHAYIVRP